MPSLPINDLLPGTFSLKASKLSPHAKVVPVPVPVPRFVALFNKAVFLFSYFLCFDLQSALTFMHIIIIIYYLLFNPQNTYSAAFHSRWALRCLKIVIYNSMKLIKT